MPGIANRRPGAGGFTYLGVLLLLAVIVLVGTASLRLGVVIHRRAAEQALLEVGAEFSAALRSYARATPRGLPDAPLTLQQLQKDPRFPGTVRHLRKIYFDPVTGTNEWGLVRDEQNNGIVGVYSLSKARPVKQAHFDSRFSDMDGKQAYSEWKFIRPDEPGTEGGGMGKGMVSGAVLQDDSSPPPVATPADPARSGNPNLISPRGLP
jgi:type II secretory pathway pseudopilin PulG